MASFFYGNSLSLWKSTFPERLGGLCHTCGNYGGVKFPLWWGSGYFLELHILLNILWENHIHSGLKDLLPLLKLDDKLGLSSTIKTDDVTRSLNNGHMFRGQVGSLVADKITKIHSQYFWWWTASHRLNRVFHKTLEQSFLTRHWKLAIPKACFHIKL